MENQDLKEVPMFFILGRPRSGTTLLRTLFDAHPAVKIPPEFPIILPLYQKFHKVKDWDEKTIKSFVDTIFNSPSFNNRKFDNLRIDRDTYTASLMKLEHNGTILDFLKSFNFYSFTLFPKKKIEWIGDKNPLYSIFAKRFLGIFPDAKFICIIRDYRDNYISMKGLSDLNLEAAVLSLQVARWRYVVKLFLKCKKKYPERFFIVRYEDLVQRQEEIFRELCSFLNIAYDPVVFDFFKKKEESETMFPKELLEKYHKSLMNPINTGRMDLWKKELTEKEVKTADSIAGKYADLLGYERKYKKLNFWVWLKTRPMTIYSYIIFKIMEYGSYLPAKLSLALTVNLLILVKTYNFFFGQKKPAVQDKK
jgi:hypothetical protein